MDAAEKMEEAIHQLADSYGVEIDDTEKECPENEQPAPGKFVHHLLQGD